MALLLDTNVVIWLAAGDVRLSGAVIDRLARGEDELVVSVVSAWEYGQKRHKRPGDLPLSFQELTAGLPYTPLDFVFPVHSFAERLPPIHSDPFDRMLVAQAIHHGLTLVASDANIQRYPADIFW